MSDNTEAHDIDVLDPSINPDEIADRAIASADMTPFDSKIENWRDRAFCRVLASDEADIFFAQPKERHLTEKQKKHEKRAEIAAKRICNICVVESECLK